MQRHREHNVSTLVFEGTMERSGAASLTANIRSEIGQRVSRVAVELDRVTSLDPAILDVLDVGHQECETAGIELVVRCSVEAHRRLFAVHGLGRLLDSNTQPRPVASGAERQAPLPRKPSDSVADSATEAPSGGVHDRQRLDAVARAELHGHLGDNDLNAVVATLRIACAVPIAVVNVVTHSVQTYPAEVGIGAPCTAVPDDLSFCTEVVDTGGLVSVADARAHPVYSQNPWVLDGRIGAYAGVPLTDAGFVLGSVSIFDSQARQFTSADLEVLRHQARLASTVLALRRTARTDALTGLLNRTAWLERVSQALSRLRRHDALAAVVYLDIDGFKGINDSYGHHVGDMVLIELARRLTAVMRSTDTLARLGGDEFVAVCEDITTPDDAARVASRMTTAMEPEWMLDDRVVAVSISIGIALTNAPGADPAELSRAADSAMYEAKRHTGSTWRITDLDGAPDLAAALR